MVKPSASPAAAAKPSFDTKAVADFYSGKTIRLIVGSAPGGGYDTYSRAIARHLGRNLPGTPNVIVENMPGGGGVAAANNLYTLAPKDGTAFGNVSSTMVQQQILSPEGVQYDASKFRYLDMPAVDNVVCVVTNKSGVKSIEETLGPNGKQLVIGSVASLTDEAKVLREALGANFKIIPGYSGTSNIRLAMDQGEVDGMCVWSWESIQATAPERVQNGDYVIISQNTGDKRFDKLPPGVPVAYELAKSEEARQLIRYGITLPKHYQRLYVVSPDVPADRMQALREGVSKTLVDPDFLADTAKAKLDVSPVPAAEVDKLVTELVNTPPAIKEKLTALIKG